MNRCSQCLPCFIHCFLIGSSWQDALLHTPCHAIKEETCTSHFRTTIVGRTNEAYVPISILTLALQYRLTHRDKVFLQVLIVLISLWQGLHHTYQCSIYPTVSAAPVAIAAIFLLVRWHIVFVSPPESLFFIEKTTSQGITTPLVGVHRIVEIFLLAGQLSIFGIDRHSHLYRINPCPV